MRTHEEDLAPSLPDLGADDVLLAWEIATALADSGQVTAGQAVLQAGLRDAETEATGASGRWRSACGAFAVRYCSSAPTPRVALNEAG